MKKSFLADIALEIKTGKTPPTSNPEYFGDEINWYTPTDLDKEKVLNKSVRGITQKAIDDKKATVLKANSVLVGCIGDIGKIGLIKKEASCNQQITAILPNEKIIDSEFLYYWFKQNREKIKSQSTSAIVPILNNKQLGAIKINYPPLEEQKHIAEVLSKAEALIAERKQSIQLLDAYLKSTFLEMFGDPVKNEKGWEIKNLSDYTTRVTKGESPKWQGFDYLEEGVRFITSENVLNGSLDLNKAKYIHEDFHNKLKRSQLQEKDLLINLVGASIGRCALVTKEALPSNINQAVAAVSLKENEINLVYLLNLLLNKSYQKILLGNVVDAARANLSLGDIRNLKIPFPPIKLQTQFAQIVEKTETLKTQYKSHLQELEQLYGSLSQRAFRGQQMPSGL